MVSSLLQRNAGLTAKCVLSAHFTVQLVQTRPRADTALVELLVTRLLIARLLPGRPGSAEFCLAGTQTMLLIAWLQRGEQIAFAHSVTDLCVPGCQSSGHTKTQCHLVLRLDDSGEACIRGAALIGNFGEQHGPLDRFAKRFVAAARKRHDQQTEQPASMCRSWFCRCAAHCPGADDANETATSTGTRSATSTRCPG